MSINGDLKIYIRNGRIGMETSVDPVVAALVCCKIAIRLLEEQVSKGSNILQIKDLIVQ